MFSMNVGVQRKYAPDFCCKQFKLHVNQAATFSFDKGRWLLTRLGEVTLKYGVELLRNSLSL